MLQKYLDKLGLYVRQSIVDDLPEQYEESELLKHRIINDSHDANTLCRGDEPLGMGGYQSITNTTAESWSLIIEPKYKKTFFRVVKHYLDKIYSKQLNRMQSLVNEHNTMAKKYHKRLGFELESRLVQYRGDTDYLLYRRLF